MDSKGKVILNPIKSNFKNMEFKKNNLGVSFKASLKENDQVKNELKLSKIDENNYENSGRFIGNDDEY